MKTLITAVTLIAIVATLTVSETQAQVVVLENFSTDTLKDPATTADWDTTATDLKLPATTSLAPIDSLTGSLEATDTSTPVDAAAQAATRDAAVGDLNGDGFVDLAFGNQGRNIVYFNNGAGGFIRGAVMPDDFFGSGNTRSVAIADFNGDGHPDLAFAEFGSGQENRIHLNNGSGGFDIFTQGEFVDLGPASLRGDSVAAGDVDNDGDIDVVLGVENDYVKLFINDGFANFSDPIDIVDPGVSAFGYHARTVLLADLNRDGDLDVVAAREDAPTRIYLGNGAGGFSGAQSAGPGGVNNALPAPDSVALGDVNGDGFLDLVVGNDGSGSVLGDAEPNYLFLNGGGSPVFPNAPIEFADMANTNGVELLDVDRDGDLDIATADFVAGNGLGDVPGPNRLYLNDGSGGFPANGTTITADSKVAKGLISGDFDNDGAMDLLYANEASATSTGENRIVFNDGTGPGTPADQLFATGLSLASNLITIPAAGVVLDVLTNQSDANTVFQYWLSADGGLTWITATPGRSVAFPDVSGNDLRWRVDMNSTSASTALQPDLDQILITRNDAPSIDSAAIDTATQDVEYTYDIDTSDPDGASDLLDIRATVIPDWLTLTDNGDGTATLQGTPTNDDVGTTDNDVTLEVVDGARQSDTQSFTIDVGDANDPPTVIAPTGDQEFDQGETVNLDTSLAFDDIDLDTLTYSATGLPTSLSIDDVTGLVTGMLTNDDAVAGPDYAVVITADDGNGGTVDDAFTLTVNNINDAPEVIAPTGNQAFTEGTDVNLDASQAFNDPDADALTYSASGLPTSLSIDTASGVISGTLTNADLVAGPVFNVVVTATELGTADSFSVDDSFTLTVTALNNAPTVVTPPSDMSADVGTVVNLDISSAFEDADGDTLTYSATGLPASLTLDADTGMVTGTLTDDDFQDGPDYAIVVTADDGNGGTVDASFTLTVTEVAAPPPPSPPPSGGGGGGGSTSLPVLLLLAGLALGRKRRRELDS